MGTYILIRVPPLLATFHSKAQTPTASPPHLTHLPTL